MFGTESFFNFYCKNNLTAELATIYKKPWRCTIAENLNKQNIEVFWYISYVVPIVAAIMLVKVHNNSDKDTVAKSRINNRVGGLRP